ncbi:MAG: acyl-CoA synthetase [Halanaeroarchaeum sp.]
MSDIDRLQAYHFYEEDWESYDALMEAFEWEVPARFNIASYVSTRWADDRPDAVAVYAEDEGGRETYTFAELDAVTDRLAAYFEHVGVEPGDRVGVNAPQRPETLFTHIAAWKAGAVSVPLSTLFGPDALAYRLDDSDARLAVVDESNVENLREVRDGLSALETVLTVGEVIDRPDETDFWTALEGHGEGYDAVETDAEDDAIIVYTSGTTGDPKGVRHAHRVMLGHLPLFVTTFNDMAIEPEDVHWTPSEWAWIASLFDVVFPALYYGRSVLAYNGGPFDPETAFSLIERYEVTNFFAPPTALRRMKLVEDPGERYDVSSIRVIPSGGESLGQDLVDWATATFGDVAVHEAYGQTEANLLVGDCTALTEFREGKIGRAAPGHEVAIVDVDSAEPTVAPGETGEIAVRYEDDPVCFKSYLNKPEKTAGKVQNGWLLTEDLGTMDEDGYVTFKSRKDDVIISAGYRIGPAEIEDTLASHEAVADAGVIGVPDEERGEVPKAFVVPAEGYEPGEALADELRAFVKDRLAKYEYPREFEFRESLPKTTTGKVRRSDLTD